MTNFNTAIELAFTFKKEILKWQYSFGFLFNLLNKKIVNSSIWSQKCCYLMKTVNTSEQNAVVGPVSAFSANSHQGCFSLVQNAKGIAKNNFGMNSIF